MSSRKGRNKTSTFKPIQSVRNSKQRDREYNRTAPIDGDLSSLNPPQLKMPQIITHIDQRQKDLTNRLTTARNTLLGTTTAGEQDSVQGVLTAGMSVNRHGVRTNQKDQREAKPKAADYISLKEDAGNGSEAINTIGAESVTSTLIGPAGIHSSQGRGDDIYSNKQAKNSIDDVPPSASLDIVESEIRIASLKNHSTTSYDFNKGTGMQNIYNGIMALTTSSAEMGVSI